MRWLLYVVFLLLVGCGPSSVEEYQSEGQAITRRMLRCLRSIDSMESAEEAQGELESLYLEYAALVVEADRFLATHPRLSHFPDDPKAEELRLELMRVYQIDGVRDIFESAQKEAVYHLNRFVSVDEE